MSVVQRVKVGWQIGKRKKKEKNGLVRANKKFVCWLVLLLTGAIVVAGVVVVGFKSVQSLVLEPRFNVMMLRAKCC